MARNVETYKGNIDEFVDWVSGENSITGANDTNNLPVDGEHIRALLQDRLKNPFYLYTDKNAGRCRIFSSRKSYELWASDKDTYSELELFNFIAPTEYEFSVSNLSSKSRYVREGNENAEDAILTFGWELKNSSGTTSDTVTITYTFLNNGTQLFTRIYDPGKTSTTENIYKYLKTGTNIVTVKLESNNYGASKAISFYVTLLELNLISSFPYNAPAIGETLSIPYVISRTLLDLEANNLLELPTIYMHFKIDSKAELIKSINSARTPIDNILTFNFSEADKLSTGLHTLLFYAEMYIADLPFMSNLIYIQFVVLGGDTGHYITFINSSNNKTFFGEGDFHLTATQYEKFEFNWAYYVDSTTRDLAINTNWQIEIGEDSEQVVLTLSSLAASRGEISETLSFIPINYSFSETSYLLAFYNNTLLLSVPIHIIKSNLNIKETDGYDLKFTAYGRSNDASNRNIWTNEAARGSLYVATFSLSIDWSYNNGWNNNGFKVTGLNNTVSINYNPFRLINSKDPIESGRTIEIEFQSTSTVDTSDILAVIGDPSSTNIKITPNSASLYANGNTLKILTNFKTGERIKLAFIIYPDTYIEEQYKNLYIIVNNGIMERAILDTNHCSTTSGNITIGGSASGITVYNIRCYPTAISFTDAYNNYVYDSDDKATIVNNNNIITSGKIDLTKSQNKLDVILIEGDLSNVINPSSGKDESETKVNIKRISINDPSKNFTITDGKIRKHGQSTLNYPIPSFKIWSNAEFTEVINGLNTTIKSTMQISDEQAAEGFNKNRYQMKDNAIPCNKWVLQANYADSSGTNNGSLQRLIQDSWYDAKINGEYKLRTPPLLFTSNEVISTFDNTKYQIVNGKYQAPIQDGSKYKNEGDYKLWKDYTEIGNTPFPYVIRTSPDSFPCVIFYKNTASGDSSYTYLGQYVFMDDKKSDYVYGQRSIYNIPEDPFCLTTAHKKDDKNRNKIWNNKGVLRMEVLSVNTRLTSYMDKEDGERDEDGNLVKGSPVRNYMDIITDLNGRKTNYRWEKDFELIYPDPEDLNDTLYIVTKLLERPSNFDTSHERPYANGELKVKTFAKSDWEDYVEEIKDASSLNVEIDTGDYHLYNENTGIDYGYFRITVDTEAKYRNDSEFNETVAPFLSWFNWLVDTYKLDNGGELSKALFQATALDHIDPYKLAAYYIFVLRFGLVDSLERNAQIKTYDGNIFWYEPWDMDIALGARNTGGIAFNPPIDRNTTVSGGNIYAISGRSETTSNWLFDALEAWPWWINEVLPSVAKALNLKYDQINKMFDEEYALKWNETFYNYSGDYKYVQSRDDLDKLQYLQGSKASHRHWWLKTSMDYYDAKWSCGDFTNNVIYMAADRNAGQAGYLTMKPYTSTYIKMINPDTGTSYGTLACSPINPAQYDISSTSFSAKTPVRILGANFIEELNISELATGFDKLQFFEFTTDSEAVLKKLYAGISETNLIQDSLDSYLYTGPYNQKDSSSFASRGEIQDLLLNIEVLDFTGWRGLKEDGVFINKNSNRIHLHDLRAKGTSITNFTNSKDGNTFTRLELPDTVSEINLYNCKFEDALTFWNFTYNETSHIGSYRLIHYSELEAEIVYHIPPTVKRISLYGNTGKNPESLQLVKDWIKCLKHNNVDLSTCFLYIENVYWLKRGDLDGALTFDDLEDIALLACKDGTVNIKAGEILLYSEIEGTTLTPAQLAWITTTYGSVFDRNNSKLIIDYAADFLQITLVEKASEDGSVGLSVIDGEVYLEEGHSVYVRATKFKLPMEATTYEYDFIASSSEKDLLGLEGFSQAPGTKVILSDDLVTGDVILSAGISSSTADYCVYLRCVGEGVDPVCMPIHIKRTIYPSFTMEDATDGNIYLKKSQLNGQNILTFTNSYSYPLYAKPSIDEYTAKLYNIEYRLLENNSPLMDWLPWSTLKTVTFPITIENCCLSISPLTSNDKKDYTIKLYADLSTFNSGDVKTYVLETRVTIGTMSTQRTYSTTIKVLKDEVILTATKQLALYNYVLRYAKDYYQNDSFTFANSKIYWSDAMNIGGNMYFRDIEGSTQKNSIITFRNSSNPILPYFESITGFEAKDFPILVNGVSFSSRNSKLKTIDLSGAASLTSLDVSTVPNLETINISGCTALSTLTVDSNTTSKLKEINMQNSGIRTLTLPEESSYLTTIKYGSPSEVKIVKPKKADLLTSDTGVTILSKSNLTSIHIETYGSNTGAFKLLSKLISN